MANSKKRKHKPLPKHPCPCCGAILSEKTIERHLTGTHLPTRIKVTHASAAAYLDSVDDLSGDLSSILGNDSDDSKDFGGSDIEATHGAIVLDIDELPTVNDPDPSTVDIVQDTWSGCHAQVNDYLDSDTEDEDFEDNQPHQTDMSDEESDFNFQEEGMGMRNGLGTDDLIDEDFQRIIAEFCASIFLFCYSAHFKSTIFQQKSFQKRILIFYILFH